MADSQNSPTTKRPVSQARIEANRRNSLKSTGPKSAEGKSIASMNSVKHGLRCQKVEPEGQRELIDARLAEWKADLRPEGAAQVWMVRRAVAASVRLDLCLEAEVERRNAAADRAEAKYVREATYRVGKLGEGLVHNPTYVVEHLEATTFGCEWLIAETARLAGELIDVNGYLGKHERDRALMILGFDPRRPDPVHPVAGPFMRSALANDLDHTPAEADAWTGHDTSALGDPAARKAAHAGSLPTMEAGRLQTLEALTAHLQTLEALRDERFAEEDGPAIDELRRRAMLASVGSKAAERLRRYETGHALDLHRSLGALTKLRKDAANRPAEVDGTSWSPEVSGSVAPAPNEANGGAPNEADRANDASVEPPASRAPNEAKPDGGVAGTPEMIAGSGNLSGVLRANSTALWGPSEAPRSSGA